MKILTEGSAPVRQVTKMGAIDISTGDFALTDNGHFAIKNDNENFVALEVKLYNGDDSWIETRFAPGWNPEICRAVKTRAGVTNIKWGK